MFRVQREQGVCSSTGQWGHGGLRTSTLLRPALLEARLQETEGKCLRGWGKLSPVVDKGEPFRGASASHFTARPGWVALGMSPRLSGP